MAALKALQPRHIAFVENYRATAWSNATEAYRQTAGFHGKAADRLAHKLLQQPMIRAEIERQQAEDRKNAKHIDIDTIQVKLIDLERRARDRNDINGEARAIELQGKTIGAFTDTIRTESPNAASDTDVVAKLASVIVQALHAAGALSTSPQLAEQAVLSALQPSITATSLPN